MSKTLRFHHVTKRFGAQAVLSDFSLDLPVGQVSCLMGPSGSGKTTLLNLLMGLVLPDSGSVQTLYPQSVVFQEDRLLPALTGLGNLRLIKGKGQDASLLRLLGELGLSGEGHKPVRDYSGGMRRRVAIARALAAEYELLLLDEPFKGLDADTRAKTAEVIRRYSQGKTVVLVTHDPQEAELMDAHIVQLPEVL